MKMRIYRFPQLLGVLHTQSFAKQVSSHHGFRLMHLEKAILFFFIYTALLPKIQAHRL
jgi:hypothetical protein